MRIGFQVDSCEHNKLDWMWIRCASQCPCERPYSHSIILTESSLSISFDDWYYWSCPFAVGNSLNDSFSNLSNSFPRASLSAKGTSLGLQKTGLAPGHNASWLEIFPVPPETPLGKHCKHCLYVILALLQCFLTNNFSVQLNLTEPISFEKSKSLPDITNKERVWVWLTSVPWLA